MENVIKITQLQDQMQEVKNKLDQNSDEIKSFESKVERKIDQLEENLKEEMKCYVRKEEFGPVRAVVYALVGTILTSVVGSLLYLIIK